MSWTIVAKKDFQDAVRSRMLWGLTALFVLFMAGIAYAYTLLLGQGGTGDPGVDTLGLIAFLSSPVALLVPITGLVIGHKAIAGEVESGSAKILLSLPHSRRDAIVGKVVGRTAVLSISIVVGLLTAVLVVLALYDAFTPLSFTVFSLLSLALGAVYTSIGVGLSALTNDSGRATIIAAGFFLVMEALWGLIPMGINYLLNSTFVVTSPTPLWYALFGRIPPSDAYSFALADFIPEASLGAVAGTPAESVLLTGGAMLALLLAWFVLTPLAGYLRFDGRDI